MLKEQKEKNQAVTANIFEQQELLKKGGGDQRKVLQLQPGVSWETNGKFDKTKKLSFIIDDMLILGCDVGSETYTI